jgi:phosphoketolase
MDLDDYKEVISLYQQKSFDLFNENIVLRSQITSLTKKTDELSKNNHILHQELEKAKLILKELEKNQLELQELEKNQSNRNQTTKKKVTSIENVDY